MPDNFDPEDIQEDPPVPDEDVGDDRHLYEMKEGDVRGQEEEPTAQLEPPPVLDDMEDMGDAAEAEEPLAQLPEVTPIPEIPEQPSQEPIEPAQPDATETVREMADMGEAAVEEAGPEPPPPVVADMAEARHASEVEVGPTPTQQEQVRGSRGLRERDLFEFDTGSFEADQSGMNWTTAESSYREVNFQWQRLMTAVIIDHQHRLEQLLAMLEGER